MTDNIMIIAGAQIAPVWGNRTATLNKVMNAIKDAASKGAGLVAFGEGLVPGYPFWLHSTHSSRFEDQTQKEIHAHYIQESVDIDRGDLEGVKSCCADHTIACYLGIIERVKDRGGCSLYCSLVYINQKGEIKSVQRKLMPTYEERLAWSIGDGNGLQVHDMGDFTVGGLNCWENWMPLARASLYAQGENLHVASWPGSISNTSDLTPIIAKEGRSFVLSISSVMHVDDYDKSIPHYDLIVAKALEDNPSGQLANGGTCVAAPDSKWIVEPVGDGQEKIITAEVNIKKVYEERQNFDPSGHYSRADVFNLTVNRTRQKIATFIDE